MFWTLLSLLLVTVEIIKSESTMEGRIHKGTPVKTYKYSYSVFILVTVDKNSTSSFYCGSSLINQRMLLTAAHCFGFKKNLQSVLAFAGHLDYTRGEKRIITKTCMHEGYKKPAVDNDIALALLRHPFHLNQKIFRIALSTQFHYGQGEIAGWGVIEEQDRQLTEILHKTQQYVMRREECKRLLPYVPKGSFCGGKIGDPSYPTEGDSGSALLMFDYLQVGLVSYKTMSDTRSIVVYTDVSYFYKWIMENSRSLYCN